ncbi:MAG: transposase, partial [Chloroflexi bacterium]|nr:transposase [Chloroflexota bacterium]
TIELKVPRVRDGSFFPSLLEPRRRAERALVAVVQEAYLHGVSTDRRVDDLVQALGMQGISKCQVSRLCADLDKEVERFRTRQLEAYPYVWLDGPCVKVRDKGRVVSQAIVIAIAVTTRGEREVLGMDVGPSESGAFRLAFLRDLTARGLNGVKLVTSDAHGGLKAAISQLVPAGSAPGCTSCGMHSACCRSVLSRWWPPPSARCSLSLIPLLLAGSGGASRIPSALATAVWRRCSMPPKPTCWRIWRFHRVTGVGDGAITRRKWRHHNSPLLPEPLGAAALSSVHTPR